LAKNQFFLLFSDMLVYTEHVDDECESALTPAYARGVGVWRTRAHCVVWCRPDDAKPAFVYLAHVPVALMTSVSKPPVGSRDDKAFGFTLLAMHERFTMHCVSDADRERWLKHLDTVIANERVNT
jgi:hypothetical protein